MKKWIFLMQLVFLSSMTFSQNTKTDSLAREWERQKIFEKVERHEKLVERLEWTSPWFIIPTIIAVFGFGWTIWLYFRGIQNKVDAVVKNKETELLIKELISKYFQEEKIKEEQLLKSKPIHLIFHSDKDADQKPLFEYLNNQHGFTALYFHAIGNEFNPPPQTGDVMVFINLVEDKFKLSENEIIETASKYKSKVKFLYYGERWEHNDKIRMSQFSNNRETLVPRLLELLKG